MSLVTNPFLPLNVYIPDGEPHIFGDRVYLFGSHDAENADTFCALDYEIYSAPLEDLSDWTSKGINYHAAQDPLSEKTNRKYMYAPDCVKGPDGRYYLYYSLSGEKGEGGYFGPLSVAVCDIPDGKYEFYGHVRNPDGTIFKKYVPFDPAVMNDDGIIRIYFGTYYPFSCLPKLVRKSMRKREAMMFGYTEDEILSQNDDVLGPVTMTLSYDMLTVASEPVRILPVHEKNTPFSSWFHPLFHKKGRIWGGHGFFEGSSIRKIKDTYYFIYSSMMNDELCYAVSKYPDHGFTYGGVIISTGDAGYMGRKDEDRLNHTATTHGSIECIHDQWYVFYHRQTHGTDYSRQACAEKITIREDGFIPQVCVTSSGLGNENLKDSGTYSAAICCNLTNGHMPHGSNKRLKGIPMLYSENHALYVMNAKKNTVVSYKYFDIRNARKIEIRLRGNGILSLMLDEEVTDTICFSSTEWKAYSLKLKSRENVTLSFKIQKGNADILEFSFQ